MIREIPRRAFLTGSMSSAVAFGLWASSPAFLSGSQISTLPRIPTGLRVRGANQVGDFRRVYAEYWGGLWTTWDWDNLIKPQIDDTAKVANAVRLFGNTFAIADGSISLNRYLIRWQQVLDYVESLGLLMYPCGGDLTHWGSFTWEQSIETYAELAQMFANYSNVIGVDITNEAYGALKAPPDERVYHQPEPADRLLSELGNIVRATGLPITHSRNIQDKMGWVTEFFTDRMSDFLDFHVYYAPDVGDSLLAYTQPWGAGKKLIVGEFGKNLTNSAENRTGYYEAIRKMCGSDPDCLGAFAWSAWDQGPTKSEQFGLFDSDRVLRSDIGDEFLKFPTRSP